MSHAVNVFTKNKYGLTKIIYCEQVRVVSTKYVPPVPNTPFTVLSFIEESKTHVAMLNAAYAVESKFG